MKKTLRDWMKLCESSPPPLVYHGTQSSVDHLDPAFGQLGTHFTENKEAAMRFAAKSDGRVFAVKLSIQNPIEMPDLKSWRLYDIREELIMLRHEGSVAFDDAMLDELRKINEARPPKMVWADTRSVFLRHGFDGVKYRNTYERAAGMCWIAFRAEQISVVEVITVSGGGNPYSW